MVTSSSPSTKTEFVAATREGIARVARSLMEGKLVILPTETVYGIAVNLRSNEARMTARAIKTRAIAALNPGAAPASPGWVVHVAEPGDVLAWAPHLSSVGKRLVSKALPGPVAFQIKLDAGALASARERLGDAADETLSPEGFLTLRCPDFVQTQEVLAAMKSPVAIIGAGTAAQPGVYELQELPAGLLQDPDAPLLALDAGATRYRKSSTLVRIEGEQFSVVRAGVIDERIIQKMADLTILFLCSGNTCRSPMAAALAARQIADHLGIAPGELPLRHIVVQSAGLHANRGMRATVEAVEAVRELGADLATHLSQPATADLLRRADVIYTMTGAHRDEVLELMPGAERKTFRLDPDADVVDPFGSHLQVYQQVASRLNSLLEKRLRELPL